MKVDKNEVITYELIAYPIKGVTNARVTEIIANAKLKTAFVADYGLARQHARDISDLPGIRRVDIFMTKTIIKRSLSGAYSMGVYMKERDDPAADYTYATTKADPPETRRMRKERRAAARKKGLG